MMMTRSLVHVHLPANPLIYEYNKAKLSLYFWKKNKKTKKQEGETLRFYNIGEANNNNNNNIMYVWLVIILFWQAMISINNFVPAS